MPRQVYIPRFPNPLVIQAADFVPQLDTYEYDRYITGVSRGQVLKNAGGVIAAQYFCAPVRLPHGALITKLTLKGYKNHASAVFGVDLERGSLVAASHSTMATATAPNYGGFGETDQTTISPNVIDNLNYTYYAMVTIDPGAADTDTYLLAVALEWS